MTIIAYDGKTLAADKRAEYCGLARTVTKIFRHEGALVGIAGNGAQAREMLAWYEQGAKHENFPPSQRDRDDWASLITITDAGIFNYERTPYPSRIEDQFMAWGSGRDYAITAMHLGKSAREAVEIACLFDVNCGNGIDTLALEP